MDADISVAPVTELVQATNLSWVALEKAFLMFKKAGIKMCPAIVFDDDLVFVGGIPTVEQIEEKLTEAYLR
ncbi:MAG: thioredoxin family protein [Candidatus Hodarchaeota archaeon]